MPIGYDRPIEDILKELAAEVPDEDWDKLPAEAEPLPKRRRWMEWLRRLFTRAKRI